MTAEAQRRVVLEYLRAVMQKRISFRSAEERKEGAERMVREAAQLRLLFRKLASVSAALALFPPQRCLGQLITASPIKDQVTNRSSLCAQERLLDFVAGGSFRALLLAPWVWH